jgi:hypothetical protein
LDFFKLQHQPKGAGWPRTLSVEAFIGSDQGGEGVKLLGPKGMAGTIDMLRKCWENW